MIIQAASADLENIIETIQVWETKLLVTEEGRKPRGSKCSQKGHIRVKCQPPPEKVVTHLPVEKQTEEPAGEMHEETSGDETEEEETGEPKKKSGRFSPGKKTFPAQIH